MGNAEISFGNNFLEIRYQREKEIPELHHLQMENGNWKMENSIANIMETAWNSSSYILHKLYLLYLSQWAYMFHFQLATQGSPFLKCVVSIWALPFFWGGVGGVKACPDGLEHFFTPKWAISYFLGSSEHLEGCFLHFLAFWQSKKIDEKHRKNCECCPGHYLIVDHYSSI